MTGVDLVFAKARTALEAMAVGCAVVLADIFGAGPLVTMREFEQMRSCNFGIRLLREPHSVDWYRSQIAAYDPADADCISVQVRQDAGLDKAVDHLLEIYERAIAEGKNSGPRQALDIGGSDGRPRATSRRLPGVSSMRMNSIAAVQSLSAEMTSARKLNEWLVEEREGLRRLVANHQELERTVQSLSAEVNTGRSVNEGLVAERESLRRLVADYQGLSIIRLRDAIVRVPILGGLARSTARWLR